jgi:hypothetical protein
MLGRAPCTIDAQSTSGPVLSDLPVDGADSPDPNQGPHHGLHHLAGRINGGGHSVTVQTGEGEIRIH